MQDKEPDQQSGTLRNKMTQEQPHVPTPAEYGRLLVAWYQRHGRDLPWRRTADPYPIWIAEVVLQQTRVNQGTAYYERFLQLFPDVYRLAAASEAQVLKAWEGLGYYSRARNLHRAARAVVEQHNGHLPADVQQLMRLPGVGPYTARAVASFAYGLPAAVLDGNVYRVLSRVLDDPTPVNNSRSRSHYQQLADGWLGRNPSAAFNHAIMDLGATVCTPRSPACDRCPLGDRCGARQNGSIAQRPVRAAGAEVKTLWMEYHWIEHPDGRFFIRQRDDSSFWKNLWELPRRDLSDFASHPSGGYEFCHLTHKLTHRELRMRLVARPFETFLPGPNDRLILRAEMSEFTFPKAIRNLLELLDQSRPAPRLF